MIEALESYEHSGSEADVLARLKKRYGLDKARCTTLLPAGSYQFVSMETPTGPEEVRTEAIRSRLQEHLEFPVEHATVDSFALSARAQSASRAPMSMVAAASNAVVAPRVRAFQMAGVALEVIDIPEMAQRNIAALCEEPQRGLVMLGFEENGVLLTFTADGELFAARRFEITLDATAGAERRAELFDRIGLELQRSLDNFDRQYPALPASRVLLGPHPLADELSTFLQSYLSLPVSVLSLSDVIDFPAVPELGRPDRQAQCLPVIGAALREEASS